MRRTRVRVVLIVLVFGALIGIGFLIGQTMVQQRRVAERTEETKLAPDIAQSIRQFHRVKVEEGRTVWDLRADQADFLEEGRVVVELPELSFFADDGQSVSLSGAQGEVMLDGPEVKRIDLAGGIEVTVGQYRLETPSASWVGSSNRVTATAGVDLQGGGVQITGDVMVVDLETRRVVFMRDVRTVLTQSEAAEEESTLDESTPEESTEEASTEAAPVEDQAPAAAADDDSSSPEEAAHAS